MARQPKNDVADYGFARARDQAYDAVIELWDTRRNAGLTQAVLAQRIGRDRAWVSRHLRGPGNWTLKTIGAFVAGLKGELEISTHPLEEPCPMRANYDAYDEYLEDIGRIINPRGRAQIVQSASTTSSTGSFENTPFVGAALIAES